MKTKWKDMLPPADPVADNQAFDENVALSETEIGQAFPGRGKVGPFNRRAIAGLLDRLEALESETCPLEKDAVNKDWKAYEAMVCAGDLVEAVAGWAIRHQIGLAKAGLEFVPRPIGNMGSMPDYQAAKAAVDDHSHESNGRDTADMTGTQVRQAVMNVVRPLLGSYRHSAAAIMNQCAEAMQDINQGYPAALTSVAPDRKRASSTSVAAKRLQLSALGFIEYRKAKSGMSEAAAFREVGSAYGGLSVSAIRYWRREFERGIEPFGPLALAREFQFARNAASYLTNTGQGIEGDDHLLTRIERRYGDVALRKAGVAYATRAPASARNRHP